MRIAIDLDKTVFYCNSLVYEVANKLFHRDDNKENFNCSYFYNFIEEPKGLINRLIQSTIGVFDYKKYRETDGSTKAIKHLIKAGHDIYYLSNRPDFDMSNYVVFKWFQQKEIPIKNIILGCSSKIRFCKCYKIDILIDDSKTICDKAIKNGINVIKFNPKGKGQWDEIVKEIDKIQEKQNQTNEKSLANNDLLC